MKKQFDIKARFAEPALSPDGAVCSTSGRHGDWPRGPGATARAVNVGSSVGFPCGGAAQTKAMKKANANLRIELVQYKGDGILAQFRSLIWTPRPAVSWSTARH